MKKAAFIDMATSARKSKISKSNSPSDLHLAEDDAWTNMSAVGEEFGSPEWGILERMVIANETEYCLMAGRCDGFCESMVMSERY